MFELPEYVTLAGQINQTLVGKTISTGSLGNSTAQDITFRARLHPRHPISELDAAQRKALYDAIGSTLHDMIAAGGRSDDVDLFGRPGGYVRAMDSKAVGRPCPVCATPIEKMQYLGGACSVCPKCQR